MAEWWNQTPVYEFEEPMYGHSTKSSRHCSAAQPRTNTYNDNLTTNSPYDLTSSPPGSARSARPPRPRTKRRNSYPPPPHAEDEHISLAREIDSPHHKTAHLDAAEHNPPAKGEIDQHPILYESELSATEAASTDTLDTILATNYGKPEGRGKGQLEWEERERKKAEEQRYAERRFVLLPKGNTYSPKGEEENPLSSDNELDYYADSRKPKTPEVRRKKPSREPSRSPEPNMGRRRSRQELPILRTDIEDAANVPPPLERSPNAYSYKPKIKEDLRPLRRNGLLSPDVGSASARTRSRGGDDYFTQPRDRDRDRDRRSRPGTPSGTSRPTTPNLTRASSDFTPRSPSALNPDTAYGKSRRDRNGSRPSSPNTSRPVTPSGERHHRRQGSRDERYDEFDKPRKTYSNPLPSPRGERLDLYDKRRVETFPPVAEGRSRPTSPLPGPTSYFDDRFSTPYPKDLTTPYPRRDHSPDRVIASSTFALPTLTAVWPPTFIPPSHPPQAIRSNHHLDAPSMGSYRRHSLDTESGHIAPLPPCPRTTPVFGAYDWLALPRCQDFNICPTCYIANVEGTGFKNSFVPRPFGAPAPDGVLCDFGTQPWYRIAWLLLQKSREPDLNLIYELARILKRHQEGNTECLGPNEAVRDWYSVQDPKTGGLVEGWDVCGCCVEIIEAVLPQLKGAFKRRAEVEGWVEGSDRGYSSGGYGSDRNGYGSDRSCGGLRNGRGRGRKRSCDMRFDTENFIHYFDALELVAEQTPRHLGRYLHDLSLFVEVVKKLAKGNGTAPRSVIGNGGGGRGRGNGSGASSPTRCAGIKELIGASWWCIAQLPELTVCDSCFKAIVKPEVENRRAIPRMFEAERRERGSCQLYSERMRRIFRECCKGDEFVKLARVARERREKEREYREDMEYARTTRWREEEEEKAGKRWRVYE